jgi:hypothetical protein
MVNPNFTTLRHGKCRRNKPSPEWIAWQNAKQRCYWQPKHNYKNYGGRGISMCDEWKNSFESFYAYMGNRPPGLTLERIDTNKGYEPGNCIWADLKTQGRNKTNNRIIYYNGLFLTLAEWEERTGIPRDSINYRITMGYPMDVVFSMNDLRAGRKCPRKPL